MCCVFVNKVEWFHLSMNTFFETQHHTPFNLRSLCFPPVSLSRPGPTDGRITPAVLLISPESFFPGWKHCHPFSLRCPPFPPFISVKWLPGGKLSSATICVRLARGSPAKNISSSSYLLHLPDHPSICPTPLKCPPITLPAHALHPCASRGPWQSPKPISEEFPCWNLYQFQRPQVLATVCEKTKTPLSLFTVTFHSFLFSACFSLSISLTYFPFLALFSSTIYLSKFTFPFPSSLTTFFFALLSGSM